MISTPFSDSLNTLVRFRRGHDLNPVIRLHTDDNVVVTQMDITAVGHRFRERGEPEQVGAGYKDRNSEMKPAGHR